MISVLRPESIRWGAVLPVNGATIVGAVDSWLAARASTADASDRWLTDTVPLLSRGEARIIPLFWEPKDSPLNLAERQDLRDRSSNLWKGIGSACRYRYGNQIGIDLPPDSEPQGDYAAVLARTGARRADWWGVGTSAALVLVVYGDPRPAPKSALALQVVPFGWVSARRPTPIKKMPALDLSWSWSDVVELASAHGVDA